MENFTFSFNTSSGLVTWSPPSFYYRDIPQGSTTIYYVHIVNQNGSVITDVNTTDTFYQIPSNFTEYCDIYGASVTAFIEQYSSLVTNATEENTGSKIILLFFLINNHNLIYQIILSTY